MKTFKEFCAEPNTPSCQCYSLQIGEYEIEILIDSESAKNCSPSFLKEARHIGKQIGAPYSAVKHSPHTTGGQHHLHLYCKNNQMFALNFDGTAHDQSHGFQIPNRVAAGIKKYFPKVKLPPGNLIEFDLQMSALITGQLLHD